MVNESPGSRSSTKASYDIDGSFFSSLDLFTAPELYFGGNGITWSALLEIERSEPLQNGKRTPDF